MSQSYRRGFREPLQNQGGVFYVEIDPHDPNASLNLYIYTGSTRYNCLHQKPLKVAVRNTKTKAILTTVQRKLPA